MIKRGRERFKSFKIRNQIDKDDGESTKQSLIAFVATHVKEKWQRMVLVAIITICVNYISTPDGYMKIIGAALSEVAKVFAQ